MDGRSTELSIEARALKDQRGVHWRLVVVDGFVTITRGKSIRRLFEHSEEAEEEEVVIFLRTRILWTRMEKELDGECSRSQKHAKSNELARKFLPDAGTVTFKEQDI